jgi:hypothetical protein
MRPPVRPARATHGTPPRWAWPAVLALHLLALWGWREATVRPHPAAHTPAALSLRWVPQAGHPAGTRALPAVQQAAAPAAAPRPARPATRRAGTAPPAVRSLRPPLPPADTATAAAQPGHPQAEAASPALPAHAPLPPGATEASAAPASPPPAAEAAALLDSAATRQAIRQLARQRLLTEQADQAAGAAPPGPDPRLGQAIAKAGKGHCAKGEFPGSGMGLLSLPFWVAALARDDCAQ